MVDYGLKGRVAVITGANNPQGIGATTAVVFAREGAKEVVPLIPMGKLMQPEDIAETVLFLASEQARMITGQVIKVSGGKAI